jgi:16S rRNA (cytosine967-C5)-methyltransferase
MANGVTRPRQLALVILRDVRGGNLADRALDARRSQVPGADAAWTQELVYGVFRLRGRIDHLLEQLVRGGLEMGSVPAYAAVSQSVELARWAGAHRAAPLVNGVLQSLHRRAGELPFPDLAADPVGFLSTWGSHPRWLIERWVGRWGVEEARALVEANNCRPELYLRLIGGSREQAIRDLGAAGIVAEPFDPSPASVRVLPPGTPRDALRHVRAVVQDPAAALVVEHAAVAPGARVIDLCSAPGGKAIGMAQSAAHVIAADLSARRLRRVTEAAERLGLLGRVWPVVADGRQPPFRPADLVLLDAPCTGTGTLRRHPDGRWRLREGDLAALAELQRELLDAAADLVLPGGHLVYSTCSLEPEENEGQVEGFLLRQPEFQRAPANPEIDPRALDARGDLTVLPQRFQVDGAYAARLRRVA